MTILMLLDREFPPDIRVENEALSLLKEGHSIHILCYTFKGKTSTEIYKGIEVHRFAINEQVAKKSLGLINILPAFKIIWSKQIKLILNSFPIDAIHAHDLPLCYVFSEFFSKRYYKVADMHENYPSMVEGQRYMNTLLGKLIFSRNTWYRKEREWLNQAQTVICVASEMQSRLEKVIENTGKIVVVPNTINLRSFEELESPGPEFKERFKGKRVISYIGGFDSSRGLNILLEGFSKIVQEYKDSLLLLVGDGSISDEIKDYSRELGIQESVLFEGWQPSLRMRSYIEISDICVIPHLRSVQTDNSSPNKLFQYMYFGKPVITSNCTSLERIVTESQCGLVYNDKSATDLAIMIKQLFDNPIIGITYGSNGRASVISRYNWEMTVKGLIRSYQ